MADPCRCQVSDSARETRPRCRPHLPFGLCVNSVSQPYRAGVSFCLRPVILQLSLGVLRAVVSQPCLPKSHSPAIGSGAASSHLAGGILSQRLYSRPRQQDKDCGHVLIPVSWEPRMGPVRTEVATITARPPWARAQERATCSRLPAAVPGSRAFSSRWLCVRGVRSPAPATQQIQRVDHVIGCRELDKSRFLARNAKLCISEFPCRRWGSKPRFCSIKSLQISGCLGGSVH